MSLRVLLINPVANIPISWERSCAMPLGLAYLAAVIEREHEVKILDCLVEGYNKITPINDAIIRYGLDWDEIRKYIHKYMPDIVGVSSMFSDQSCNAHKICEIAKDVDSHCITIMGGVHPSCVPEMVMADKNVDFVILGEGEETFPCLLRHIEDGKEPFNIDGLVYRDKTGKLIVNRKTKFIKDLDSIPFPARHLLPMDKYFAIERQHGFTKRTPHTIMITSRGCPANCIFCSIHAVWGKGYRGRSSENVLREVEELVMKYGIKEIHFEDDNLTFDKNRAEKIFNGIIEKKWNIYWAVPNGIALWSIDKALIPKMKKSGCYYLSLGIESGDQDVLDKLIKKPLKLNRIKYLVNDMKKQGIKVRGLFVLGVPGETKEQIERTIDFAANLKLNEAQFNIITPYPGTTLWKTCEERSIFKVGFRIEDLLLNRSNIETIELSTQDLMQLQKKAMIKFNLSKVHDPFFLWDRIIKVTAKLFNHPREIKEVGRKIKTYFKVLIGLS